MNNLFIKPEHLKLLKDIFNKYCPEAEIWAYGSRVKNEAHEGSDLDLTVINWNAENKSISELKSLLQESSIPFLVDINDFNTLPDSFKQEILKNHIKMKQ